MSSPPKLINSGSIFAESNRIISANQAQFFSLSFLFFFPLFISLTSLLAFLRFILSQANDVSLKPLSFVFSYYINSPHYIALSLLYALLILFLYVAGVATITYATQQVLYGKVLKFSSTINSLSKSFFSLAFTTLTSVACLLSASIIFLLFFGSFLNSLQIIGFQINYSSRFCAITFAVIAVLFLITFHIHLILAAIISVIESKRGFEPLRRSYSLVKGMKKSSLFILLLRGISMWTVMLGLSTQIFTSPDPGAWSYLDALQILIISFFWMLIMSPLVNAYTVLYLNCKDLHEESGFDISVDISNECVSLAIDDNKLVHESNVRTLVFAAALVSITLVVVGKVIGARSRVM